MFKVVWASFSMQYVKCLSNLLYKISISVHISTPFNTLVNIQHQTSLVWRFLFRLDLKIGTTKLFSFSGKNVLPVRFCSRENSSRNSHAILNIFKSDDTFTLLSLTILRLSRIQSPYPLTTTSWCDTAPLRPTWGKLKFGCFQVKYLHQIFIPLPSNQRYPHFLSHTHWLQLYAVQRCVCVCV